MIAWHSSRLLLALLLVVSLAVKIPGSTRQENAAAVDVAEYVAVFLKRHGFKVDEGTSDVDMFSLSASSGSCRLLVAVLSPQGWHSDIIRKLTPASHRLFFLYDGVIYPDQPVLLTRIHDYWSRFLRYAGRDSPLQPVLGIAGSPGCALDGIPWNELPTALST
jgi:hypothetical protein